MSAAVVDRALEPTLLSKWRCAHMARVTALSELRAREGEVATGKKHQPEIGILFDWRNESGAKSAAVVDRALEPTPLSKWRCSHITALSVLRAREGVVATGKKHQPEIGIRVDWRKESGAKSAAAVDRALELAPLSQPLIILTSLIYIAFPVFFEYMLI